MEKGEIEGRFGISYLSSLTFGSSDVQAKIEAKCKRSVERGQEEKESKWRTSLYHKEMKEKREIPFLLKEVHPIIGHGVFATQNIPFLTFIGEYTGVVRRRNRREDRSNEYIFGYTIGSKDTPWVIDAEKQGNFTRFINHSYEPNLTSTWIIADGISHIIFFANRLILAGEQLTYDYGVYYWGKRAAPLQL